MVNFGDCGRFLAKNAEQSAFMGTLSFNFINARTNPTARKSCTRPIKHNENVRPEAASAATMMFVPRAKQGANQRVRRLGPRTRVVLESGRFEKTHINIRLRDCWDRR
jgi:hypothetical protein